MSCGYNLLTGRAERSASSGGVGDAAVGAAKRVAALGGRFGLGCALSAAGAAIGAGVWIGVAYGTGYEVGYIAWALGLLAGVGMYWGNRATGAIPGVAAATIALFGVVGAKIGLFLAFTGGGINLAEDERPPREVVASILADDVMDEVDLPDSATDEEWEAAYDKAEQAALEKVRPQVEAMSDAEIQRRVAEHRETSRKLSAELNKSLFMSFMFGWMDLIFVGLAIVSAYRLGSSGFGSG